MTHRPVWAATFLVVLTMAAFANTLSNVFALDDVYRIVDNPGIRSVQPWWRHFVDVRTMATLPTILGFRPLLPLTLSFNYALGGLQPEGYHLVNIALQTIAAVLTFGFVRHLLRANGETASTPLAAATAALFAIHPVSGIAVNYVSARDLLLMEVFLVGSLWSYARMRAGHDSLWGWALSLSLFTLALLSKGGAAVMPALILAYEVLVLRAPVARLSTWLRPLPFFMLTAAVTAYTSLVLGHSEFSIVRDPNVSPLRYALDQAAQHLWHYGRNFVWPLPIRQAPEVHTHTTLDVWVVSGAVAILASLWVAWRQWRARPAVSFGIVAYWILSIPESSLLPLWAHVTDYRPYAGSPFLLLALVVPVASATKGPARVGLFAGVLLFLLTMTWQQNATWRSGRALWEHSVRHGGSSLAYLNLAMTYPEPEPRQRFLREALRLYPRFTFARINLGLSLLDQGRQAEGVAECEQAVKDDPLRAIGHYWLARVYERVGRANDGARAATDAVRLDPQNHEHRYLAARLAEVTGDFASALEHLRPLVEAAPPYRDAWFLEAWARQSTGDAAAAEQSYRRQVALDSAHVQAHFNLGYLQMQRKACAEAVPQFERVLALRPTYGETHLHLATCLEQLGRVADAETHRRQWEASSTAGS